MIKVKSNEAIFNAYRDFAADFAAHGAIVQNDSVLGMEDFSEWIVRSNEFAAELTAILDASYAHIANGAQDGS
jgi:hypothetical protein